MEDRTNKPHNWPIHTAKDGMVEAAIWERTDQKTGQARYHVTLSRSYQNKDGAWTRTATFDHKQLSSVAKVTQDAQTWILERTRELAKEKGQARSHASVQANQQTTSSEAERTKGHEEDTKKLIKHLIKTLSKTNDPGNSP